MVALLAANISQAALPACSSTAFDADGDGWGWENHQSCVVTPDTPGSDPIDNTAPAKESPSNLNRHPACTLASSDPDGDGWGWENQRSCYVSDNGGDQVVNDNGDPDLQPGSDNADDSDPVVEVASGDRKHPYCELASSDPDGDGWGWENSRSCIVAVTNDEVAKSDELDTEEAHLVEPGTDDNYDAKGDEPTTPVDTDPESEKNDSPVIYMQDFESAENGLYQSDQLNEGWNQPFWHLGFDQGRVRIIADTRGGQVMQVTFPAGTYGSDGASAFLSDIQFGMELPKTYDELYLSYDIMFADNFEFVLGGKLPGLCGANSDSVLTEGCNTGGGKPNGFDGWSARGMWRADGALEHYTYHAGQQNYWADSLLWNVKAKRGTWHRIQHRVVLNTVGASDGILEAWVDGQKVLSNTQLEYRKTESVGINLFYFSTFFGGNDPSWAPKTDQILYFDNFVISTENTN